MAATPVHVVSPNKRRYADIRCSIVIGPNEPLRQFLHACSLLVINWPDDDKGPHADLWLHLDDKAGFVEHIRLSPASKIARMWASGCLIANPDMFYVKSPRWTLQFPSSDALDDFIEFTKRRSDLAAGDGTNAFDKRTDEASSAQYFQFYGYLTQQQNMLQVGDDVFFCYTEFSLCQNVEDTASRR